MLVIRTIKIIRWCSFDQVNQAITAGKSSLSALKGSTEEEQFSKAK